MQTRTVSIVRSSSNVYQRSAERASIVATSGKLVSLQELTFSLSKGQYGPVEVVLTEKKGYGLRAKEDIRA